MAKRKNDDNLYNGLNLFDFMSGDISKNIKTLEQRLKDGNNTTNNNSRETNGLHSDRLEVFGGEFNSRVISRVSNGLQQNEFDNANELHSRGDIETVDKRVSENKNNEENGSNILSTNQSRRDRDGSIRVSNLQETTSNGDNGYGDVGREGNRPVQGSEISHRLLVVGKDFNNDSEIILTGAKDKYNKNIEAIKVLKTLEDENRFATHSEQVILNSYTGWGGIPQAFDKRNNSWTKEYNELKELLTSEEYSSARASTLDSHYTPKVIIDTIYKSLKHFGFDNYKEQKDILEPSAGNGAFLSYAKNHFDNLNFTAIELDKISMRLLSKLYPNQDIIENGFEKYKTYKKFDAVIGNPPYGQKRIFDTQNLDISMLTIHNYFSARAIKELKEDGIMAFVTSSYFLDSKDSSLREQIINEATFIGAIRLPNDIFKNKANAEVTTDIIFFKKGFNQELHQNFNDLEILKNTENDEKPILINEYFIKNPQNVLGTMKLQMSGIGEVVQCINENNLDIEAELDKAINRLPKDIYKYQEIETTHDTIEIQSNEYLKNLKVNNYLKHNNEIYLKLENKDETILCQKNNELSLADKKRIDKFINLRDSINNLIKLEQTNIPDNDERLLSTREELNKYYDEFVKSEGYLHRLANKKIISKDADGNKIIALEVEYNEGISKAVAKK